MFRVQDLFFLGGLLRDGRSFCGVLGDQVYLDRHAERFMQHHVDPPYRGIRKCETVFGMLMDPPLFFHFVVELLDIGSRYEGDLFFAEVGLDVCSNILPVGTQRVFPDGPDHVFLDPFIQPFAECHSAFFCQLGAAEFFLPLMTLFKKLFLCFCVDVAEDRRTVRVVPDDDPALPLSGLFLSDHTLAGCSAFCHTINPPLRFPGPCC